jgi:hypothetical protein
MSINKARDVIAYSDDMNEDVNLMLGSYCI